MTHGRKPRRPRWQRYDPIKVARNAATKLTPAEISQVMTPIEAAVAALRKGTGTELDWSAAVTAVSVADVIEGQGIVRGLAGHLLGIDQALQGIRRRAMDSGDWRAPALYFEEREQLDLLVDLHGYQVRSLSYGEYCRAYDKAVAQTLSAGGRLITPAQSA